MSIHMYICVSVCAYLPCRGDGRGGNHHETTPLQEQSHPPDCAGVHRAGRGLQWRLVHPPQQLSNWSSVLYNFSWCGLLVRLGLYAETSLKVSQQHTLVSSATSISVESISEYACRSRGNGGQGVAVVIRRDAKSLLTLDLHCNIILFDMTLHSCKSSHNVLYLHVFICIFWLCEGDCEKKSVNSLQSCSGSRSRSLSARAREGVNVGVC